MEISSRWKSFWTELLSGKGGSPPQARAEEARPMEKQDDESRRSVKLTARTARARLKSVPRTPSAISLESVLAALGGRALAMDVGDTRTPVTLLAVRDALSDRLRSTGGRPALSGDGLRQRVQVSTHDWKRIASIADHIEVGRHKPSPAQVASVLIHLALERISPGEIDRLIRLDARD